MGRVSIVTGMDAGGLPTGTVTFLLADVEGSSRLWEAGADAMTAAMTRFNEIVDETVVQHSGARPVEQGEGDSFLAGFPRASDAVACALGLQLALEREEWCGPPISVRIGLHTGEARLRDEGKNYAGDAVNRCARLRNLGHGGQTLLSRSTYELVVESLPEGASLRDLGPHRLRDLQRPEHVWQLCHPDLADDFPPLRSLEAMPNNLPAQLTSFVGRETEMAEVRALVGEHRIVTLTGSGGVGKTRLAVEAAADLLDQRPDGVWWVDLAPTTSADLVPKAIATAARIREVPTRTTTDLLLLELRDKSVLIILDNCEHLTDACAEIAEQLVRECPRVAILATSREPLGVAGEVTWRVPSLSLPEEDVGSAEAVRLFRDRAVAVRPNFRITDANAFAVAEICRQLEGIPLAIELAAARVRVLTPAQIAAGLSDRFHLLTGGGPRALPRQRTLEASVDWSYNLLSSEERVLLRRLSVFAGGFTLDAAEAVCADDIVDAYRVLDLLSSLVDRSLVQVDDEGPQARYRLLETIRQYAGQRLVDAGEGPSTGDNHLAFYLQASEKAARNVAGNLVELVEELELDHDNYRGAIDWAVRTGRVDQGLRLGSALTQFWSLRSGREGLGRLETLLALDGADPSLASRARTCATILAFNSSDFAASRRHAHKGLEIARKVGDPRLLGRALQAMGPSLAFSEPERARPLLEEGLQLAAAASDVWCEFYIRFWLGAIDVMKGNLAAGRDWFESALALGGGRWLERGGRMTCLALIGMADLFAGEIDRARPYLEESLAIAVELGSDVGMSMVLPWLAIGSWMGGQSDRAESMLEEAERAVTKIGTPNVFLLLIGGLLRAWRGDRDRGVADIDAALRFSRAAGIHWIAAMSLCYLGAVELTAGDLGSARSHIDEALDTMRDLPVPIVMAWITHFRGVLAGAEGDRERAQAFQHEALAISAESGNKFMAIAALEALGGLGVEAGAFETAARLYGAAEALRRATGVSIHQLVPAVERQTDVVAEALAGDAFEKAWAEGEAMSMDEVVAYVLRGRGPRGRPSAGWDSLTPREVDVVRLVAQGLTNPEIGEKLFLSKRTVQAHLSRIFAKVGVSSRAELSSEATRRSPRIFTNFTNR